MRKTNRWQLIFGILVAVGLVALAISGYLTPLTRLVVQPVVGVQTWLAERVQAVKEFTTAPSDLALLRQRIANLEAENSRLQIEVIELQQQVQQAAVLSTLVDYARSSTENRYLAASVIGYDTSPFLRYILINRGSDDGLRRGMPVVTNQGLVGQVAAVNSSAARVQLITDPAASVNVYLQRADAEAVVQGQLTGEITLEMVPQSAALEAGDLIVTSGLGGNYPANLVIGQVTSVRQRDSDLFQSAAVQPAVNFAELEIVLVITNFRPVDTSSLIP
ncbi:MAG: rod shape-determining protein MreC [Anaerolineales bacterium]|jgi:rod shape-determining protein MreC|nr:rod shape-determining protein MreC [Anaerolineales bacterium]